MATPVLRSEGSIASTRIVRQNFSRRLGPWLSLGCAPRLQDGSRQARLVWIHSFSWGTIPNPNARSVIRRLRRAPVRWAICCGRRARVYPKESSRLCLERFHLLRRPGKFRHDYVKEVLEDEIGELTALDHEVVDSLQQHEILSENIGKEFEKDLSFGERLSDRIASFGGSWPFIILFGAVLFVWIIFNTIMLASRAFDPYPFILLNLILSCLAAIQAPIIMMSQNRSEARDRARSENDYKVNLKAEWSPPSAREDRSPFAQAVQPLVRNSADSARVTGRDGAKRRAPLRPSPGTTGETPSAPTTPA